MMVWTNAPNSACTITFAFGSNQDSQRSGDTQSVQAGDSAAHVFVDTNCLDAFADRELHNGGFTAIEEFA